MWSRKVFAMKQNCLDFNPDSMLDTTEVASMLGVSWDATAKWRSDGVGPPFVKNGKEVRYSKVGVLEWLETGGRDWLAKNAGHRNQTKACSEEERKARNAVAQRRYNQDPARKLKAAAWKRALRAEHPERDREYRRKWAKKNPEKIRAMGWRAKFNIAAEQVEHMMKLQEGRCAICRDVLVFRQGNSAGVDHCHLTGKVRALLCSHCNSMLGQARDNPAILRFAAAYIEAHRDALVGSQHPNIPLELMTPEGEA